MAIHDDLDVPLAEACRRAGGQSALARVIGCDQSTVHEWLRDLKPLPAEHVFAVEGATGVSRHELRLDLYPREGCHAEQCPEHGARPSAIASRESNPSSVGDDKAPPANSPAGGASRARQALQGARA